MLKDRERPAHQPGYHYVRDAIREDIVEGVFGPDGRMKMRDLTVRYALSPAPIREALGQLEAEGLVVLHANRGATARTVDATFVREIYDIRRALEPMLVARASAAMTEADLAEIEALASAFEAAAAQGDNAAVIEANARFHARIYRVAPNSEAIRLLRQHSSLLSTIRRRYGFGEERLGEIVREHRMLVEACARRDAESASAIARLHITHSMLNVVSRLEGGTR